jgi:transposase
MIPVADCISATEYGAMVGRRRRDQGRLFYEFRLEDRIPENHLFVTVAFEDLHKELEPHYSDIGRPSVDPELMIRMLIIGYCYGIRSERRLAQEVGLHLAYGGFRKLDLDDQIPHHSTFSSNRLGHVRESDVLRHIFARAQALRLKCRAVPRGLSWHRGCP